MEGRPTLFESRPPKYPDISDIIVMSKIAANSTARIVANLYKY